MTIYLEPIHSLHKKRLNKEVSTKEIAQAVIKRIDETDDTLGVYLQRNKTEEILALADAADAKIAKGEKVTELEGMPIGMKDIFSTKGITTTCGSQYLKDYVPPYESTVSQRLLNQGYNLLGKINMDEFAMGSSNENSGFKPVKNPWNLDCVPGGSSGGSAAAVAAGLSLASIGTDTGGSIRQPASFNNIVGLKPSYGRVSRWGMIAFASSLDQAGPMTRDVEDAALMLEAIWGYDPHDATSLKSTLPNLREELNKDVKGMKIGVIKDLDLSSCDPEVISCFEANLEVFKKGGAEIVEVELPNIKHAVATYYVIAPCECSSNLGRYDGVRYGHRAEDAKNLTDLYELSRDQSLGPEVKLRILLGTFALSAGYYDAYYLKAQKIQDLIRAQFQSAFKNVDAIASPVTPVPPFKFGEKLNDPIQMYLSDAFTIPANLAGIPGISVPGGFTKSGLPMGLQLLTGMLREDKLVRVAHWFEKNNEISAPKLAI
ncbi:MAG: Asp-tRNA(Asn)/Glu-tRNA(Gln) amidotransferase subunit GatA [SAR324 cluster bacterium]|nr:Asp-tRNA(Asn)/Glu-tRNA(Gln) amidotransferase subunit GatA [SAR324 cluster bacterium]